MQRLTGADASFLYMENPSVHMHVTGVMILDPSTVRGEFSFERFRHHLECRMKRIPLYRKRLLKVPFGLDHPVWADDPHFDLDNHFHHVTLDPPGSDEQLAAFAGEYASEPLPRDRPVWDMAFVDGLARNTVAVVSKIHHVAVDGITGTDLMAQLLDLEPDVPDDEAPRETDEPRPLAGPLTLTADALLSRASDPLRGVRSLLRTIRSIDQVRRTTAGGREGGGPSMARPFDAPRTVFNRSLTPRRSVAFARAPLDDLKFVKNVFGTTVNDVFLAACTSALRTYLIRHGDMVDRPLLASVPVSVHGKTSDVGSANQVSNMFVRLPVDIEDPVEQLHAVRLDTRGAKAVHGAIGANMIGDVTELTPPGIFNLASRMYSRAGLAERLPPIQNLVISNVPGPPIPLYVAGARLLGVFPFGPLIEGSGLNITVISNVGNMDIGVIGCPDIAPGIDELARDIVAGIGALRAAADAASTPVGSPQEPAKRNPTGKATVKSPAKKSAAKKSAAKKSTAKKSTAKKTAAKKTAGRGATGKPPSKQSAT